jgi:hypothetical protein
MPKVPKKFNKDLECLSIKRDISSTSSDPKSCGSENCDEFDNEFCDILTPSFNKKKISYYPNTMTNKKELFSHAKNSMNPTTCKYI